MKRLILLMVMAIISSTIMAQSTFTRDKGKDTKVNTPVSVANAKKSKHNKKKKSENKTARESSQHQECYVEIRFNKYIDGLVYLDNKKVSSLNYTDRTSFITTKGEHLVAVYSPGYYNSCGRVYIENSSTVFDCNMVKILMENGHEAVDLGLSVKWASCNIDADNSTDIGGYYSFGETETKDIGDYNKYKYFDYCDASGNYI